MNFSRNLPNQRVAERDEEIIEKNDGSIERKTKSKANQIKTVDQWTVAACRFAVTDVPETEYSEYFRYSCLLKIKHLSCQAGLRTKPD